MTAPSQTQVTPIPVKTAIPSVLPVSPISSSKSQVSSLFIGPSYDVSRLSAQYPLVLFPIRIETKFLTGSSPELLVRVIPDEITADSHETPLTEAEENAGQAYWKQSWDPKNSLDAWRLLVSHYPSTRAAWIVRATTPTNIANRSQGEPVFPTIQHRDQNWTRPVWTNVLPDYWIALAYRGDVLVAAKQSSKTKTPLALTISPTGLDDSNSTVLIGDSLRIDKGIAWTLDFKEAEDAGMAIRITPDVVKDHDLPKGFDRLVVLGIKVSSTSQDCQRTLEQLFDAHHYTRGLAFVPQGTPTNNTSESPSGFPPADPDGSHSFEVEIDSKPVETESDALTWAHALGVKPSLVDHLAHTGLKEQAAARSMNYALAPATIMYFLQQMTAPLVTEEMGLEARKHFVTYVRGRGPFPAFRVGETPYGLLPVSSLSSWQPRPNAKRLDLFLPKLLQSLRKYWENAWKQVPRVGQTENQEADLIRVLGMGSGSKEVRLRYVLGGDLQSNLAELLDFKSNLAPGQQSNVSGIMSGGWSGQQEGTAQSIVAELGHKDWNPRILHSVFANNARLLDVPLVTDQPLSEECGLSGPGGLSPNYIQDLYGTNSIQQLKQMQASQDIQKSTPLLQRMLRFATLTEYARVAIDILEDNNLATEDDRYEPELVGIVPGTEKRPTVWEKFALSVPESEPDSLGDYLLKNSLPSVNRSLQDYLLKNETVASKTMPIETYRKSLQYLKDLPTAELSRLFTEALDVCSNRIDAWITSLATQRLEEMRSLNPKGCYLAGWGFVEDLHPAPTVDPSGNGEYIQGPSMSHASAAAVLRSAYLARNTQGNSTYAVDLSSKRVRLAKWLLDQVRQGQPLEAVLGYRFERGLHDRNAGLEKFIQPFREAYPLVSSNTIEPSGNATESLSARNVVNGLALREALRAGKDPLILVKPAAPPTAEEQKALLDELQNLDDAVDAVADLLTAESVYQVVRGNKEGAAATLDSMAQGVRPPEPEIAHQPRGGTPLTHRVLVVLEGNDGSQTGAWIGQSTPRSRAEPSLDAWVGVLLGDPTNVKCRITYHDPSDTDPESRTGQVVLLSDLNLRSLDILALARGISEDSPSPELDQRVLHTSLGDGKDLQEARVTYASDPTWNKDQVRTFSEVFEVARGINNVLGGARPLEPEDFVAPGSAAASTQSLTDNRADAAKAELQQLWASLDTAIRQLQAAPPGSPVDLSQLHYALRQISLFGVPGAFPSFQKDAASSIQQILSQSRWVLDEVDRRLRGADTSSDPTDVMHALFGRDFVFLPRFNLPNPDEIGSALAYGPTLLSPSQGGSDSGQIAILKWFLQAARVRASLSRWRRMSLYTSASGQGTMDFEIAQLPHDSNARWVGLPFRSEDERPLPGRLSLAIHRPGNVPIDRPWAGLYIDGWSELIPFPTESTGIAFQHSSPATEAPQALLIAVPPGNTQSWDLDSIIEILNETIDLIKIRAVDTDLLGDMGQLLPATYLAANESNQTIAAGFPATILVSEVERSHLAGQGAETKGLTQTTKQLGSTNQNQTNDATTPATSDRG